MLAGFEVVADLFESAAPRGAADVLRGGGTEGVANVVFGRDDPFPALWRHRIPPAALS